MAAATSLFGGRRAWGAGVRSDSAAAEIYFDRFRESKKLFLFALDTGFRLNDFLSLRWENVDFAGGYLAIVMKKTRRFVAVPLSERCRSMLKRERDRTLRQGFVLNDELAHRMT